METKPDYLRSQYDAPRNLQSVSTQKKPDLVDDFEEIGIGSVGKS